MILSHLNCYRIAFCLQAGLTESEMRTAVLKAIGSYLDERAKARKRVNERPQTPGTDIRPQPSAPPAMPQAPGTDFRPQPSAPPTEEEEECGSTRNIAVAECVVCMDRKVSVVCRAEDCLWEI